MRERHSVRINLAPERPAEWFSHSLLRRHDGGSATGLPQFVDPAAGSVTAQVLVLGIVVTATALPCDFAVAFAAGGAARFLRGNAHAMRIQRWLSGSILVGLGAWVMLARRGAD
jgi:hypothetical protein